MSPSSSTVLRTLRGQLRDHAISRGVLDGLARLRIAVHRAAGRAGDAVPEASAAALGAVFERVHGRVPCAHSLAESLAILELVLAHRGVPGDIAEFGVFKGGMTTKLSWVAAALERSLWAYDSYEGLPDPVAYGTGEQVPTYSRKLAEGDRYRGSLPEVQANVTVWGVPDRCVFVKGYFRESLAPGGRHPDAIAFAFVDVDLTRSLRECLRFLWPRMSAGGVLFCHEARDPEIVRELAASGVLDHDHRGVGTGLGPGLDNLCWIRRR